MSLIPDIADDRDFIKEIPEKVDKTFIDLTEGLSVQIRNQYSINACTCFSTAYFMSILSSKLLGKWVDFDPWFVYYKARELDGNLGENVGLYYRDVMKALQKYGSITKDATKLSCSTDIPTEEDCKLAGYNKIRSYVRIPNDNLINGVLHTLINERLPVITCALLYDKSWAKATNTGKLEYINDDPWIGNHAMCIYGYDPDDDMFLLLNSHGYDFGKNGRLKMSSEYLKLCGFDNWTVGFDYY